MPHLAGSADGAVGGGRGHQLARYVATHAETVAPGSVALLAGLVALGSKPWWFDEAYDVWNAREGWPKFVLKAGYYEPSQFLYLIVLKAWRMFTPETEWFTRLPSVAFTVAAAMLVGRLGTRLFGQRVGVIAGILTATNATVVEWSQQTRTYGLALLAAVVVTVLFVRAAESDDRRAWIAYGLAGALGVYAHFFVGFVIAAHAVALPRLTPFRRRRLVTAWGIVALAVAPSLPFILIGGRGGADWIQATSLHGLLQGLGALDGGNLLALGAAAVGAVILLAFPPVDLRSRPGTPSWAGALLVAWALAPLVGALVVSLLKPVLVGRYLIVSTPAIALLGAIALACIRPRVVAAGAAAGLLGVSGVQISRWYALVPEDWSQAARVGAAAERAGTPVAVEPAGYVDAYQLYGQLPGECRRLVGHHEPRCAFHAQGARTLLLTVQPERWREVPGSAAYTVARRQRLGAYLWAMWLVRK